MFKTIVVAYDGTTHARTALDIAAKLAVENQSRLILVHAVMTGMTSSKIVELAEQAGIMEEIKDDLDNFFAVSMEATADEEAAVLMEVIPDTFLEKVGALLLRTAEDRVRERGAQNVSRVLCPGDAAKAVLDVAAREKADLIIVGSRGLGELKSLVLGSVSHKVVQNAACPCLIVK